MTNWCDNTLYIVGHPADIEQFMLDNENILAPAADFQALTFQALLPVANNASGQSTWGTRTDAANVASWSYVAAAPEAEATITFLTAWGPPRLWVAEAARCYPAIYFSLHYSESGNQSAGELIGQDGVMSDIVDEHFFDYLEYEAAD